MKNSQYFLVVVLLFFLNTLEAGIVKLESISSEFYTEFDGEEVSIDIFDPETDEILIQVDVDPGDYEVIKKGEVWKVNSKQEFIFYKDYNSDGLKDIAVKTGEICGVPQLTVYFKKAGQKFSESNSYVLPSDRYVDNENVLDYILKLDGFSEEYFAVVDGKKKHLCIIDKKSKQILVNANIEEVDLEYDSSHGFQSNISERPYGYQSLIVHDDFNFDGKKDFAIKDGNGSCYGGPEFSIYLNRDQGFVFDQEFSAVASEYCGMFGVDRKTQTISAMKKSGCCWHLYDTYKVINGQLKLVKSVEEDAYNLPFYSTITKEYNEKKVVTKKRVEIDENEINQKLNFKLKNGKTALLFERDKNLYYAFLDKDNSVEFSMGPVYNETIGKNGKSFVYVVEVGSRRELNFNTEDAKYAIYQNYKVNNPVGIGITVETKDGAYDLVGLPDTVVGDLVSLADEPFENLWVAQKGDDKYALDIYENLKRMTPTQLTAAYHNWESVNFLSQIPNGKDSIRLNEFLATLKEVLLSKDKYRLLPLIDEYYLANQVILNEFDVSLMLDERILGGYNKSISKSDCKLKSTWYLEREGCYEKVNLEDVQNVEMELVHSDSHSGRYLLVIQMKKNNGTSVKVELYVGKAIGKEGEVKYTIIGGWG